jgi:hypothetical protein
MGDVVDLKARILAKAVKQMKPIVAPLVRTNTSTVCHVDFATRKLIETSVSIDVVDSSEEDTTHFRPVPTGSNFSGMSARERVGHSNHVLKYWSELSFADLMHFVHMGVLDQKKLAESLNIPYLYEELTQSPS